MLRELEGGGGGGNGGGSGGGGSGGGGSGGGGGGEVGFVKRTLGGGGGGAKKHWRSMPKFPSFCKPNRGGGCLLPFSTIFHSFLPLFALFFFISFFSFFSIFHNWVLQFLTAFSQFSWSSFEMVILYAPIKRCSVFRVQDLISKKIKA